VLDAATRERIAIALAEANRCGYCLSAHAALGRLVGLPPEEIAAARAGRSSKAKAQAAVALALAIVETKGGVGDAALAEARAAGLGDGEIAEIVGVVALNLLTNLFNRLARTEIDFPKVALADAA
jgi:AhpD family alkylhydroperoxidase